MTSAEVNKFLLMEPPFSVAFPIVDSIDLNSKMKLPHNYYLSRMLTQYASSCAVSGRAGRAAETILYITTHWIDFGSESKHFKVLIQTLANRDEDNIGARLYDVFLLLHAKEEHYIPNVPSDSYFGKLLRVSGKIV